MVCQQHAQLSVKTLGRERVQGRTVQKPLAPVAFQRHTSGQPEGAVFLLCLVFFVFYILCCALSAVICVSQWTPPPCAPLMQFAESTALQRRRSFLKSYHFLFKSGTKSMILKPGASKSRFSGSAPLPKSYHFPLKILMKSMILSWTALVV